VFVAAGGNIEPERYLPRALEALAAVFAPLQCSPWYRNEAAGFSGADFINLVVAFDTEYPVGEVRAALQRIEALCDRPPQAPKWAPRTMDLDLLLYGALISAQPPLPRPDLLKRAYMLGPLADLAPQLRHPTAGRTIGELWADFDRAAHPLHSIAPARQILAPAATSSRCARHPHTGPAR